MDIHPLSFTMVWFYGISTILDYIMPTHVYTYILNIYDLSAHFVDKVFKWDWAYFLHTVKWFQVLLCLTNNSIKHQTLVYSQ